MVDTIGPADDPIGYSMDFHGLVTNVTKFVPGQISNQHFGIDTDDMSQLEKKLKANGATLVEKRLLPDGRNVCFFEDPDGVRVEVIEAKK